MRMLTLLLPAYFLLIDAVTGADVVHSHGLVVQAHVTGGTGELVGHTTYGGREYTFTCEPDAFEQIGDDTYRYVAHEDWYEAWHDVGAEAEAALYV